MIELKKPKKLILSKFPKNVVDTYLKYKDKANDLPTAMIFYVKMVENELQVYSLPIIFDDVKRNLEVMNNIMSDVNFIKWI